MADQNLARLQAEWVRQQVDTERRIQEILDSMQKLLLALGGKKDTMNGYGAFGSNGSGAENKSEEVKPKEVIESEANEPHHYVQEAWKSETKPMEEVPEVTEIKVKEPLSFIQAKEEPKKPFCASSESLRGSKPSSRWNKKHHRRFGPCRGKKKSSRGKTERPQRPKKLAVVSDEEPVGSLQANHLPSETHKIPDHERPTGSYRSSLMSCRMTHRGRPPESDEEMGVKIQADRLFLRTHNQVDHEHPSERHCSARMGCAMSHRGQSSETETDSPIRSPDLTLAMAIRAKMHTLGRLNPLTEMGAIGNITVTLESKDELMGWDDRLVLKGTKVGIENPDPGKTTKCGCRVVNESMANIVASNKHGTVVFTKTVRKVARAGALVKTRKWWRNKYAESSLAGKTILRKGFRRVGSEAGWRVKRLGIIVHDPYVPRDSDQAGIIGVAPWTKVPYLYQRGVLTFDVKEIFARMAASIVALVGLTGAFIESKELSMFWIFLREKMVKEKNESLVRSRCVWRISGESETARPMLDKIAAEDLVTEISMILRYVHNGCNSDTLELFNLIPNSRVKINWVSSLGVLLANDDHGVWWQVGWFYNYIAQDTFEPSVIEVALQGDIENAYNEQIELEHKDQRLSLKESLKNRLNHELDLRSVAVAKVKEDILSLKKNLLTSTKKDLQVKASELEEIKLKLQKELNTREVVGIALKTWEAKLWVVEEELTKVTKEEEALEEVVANIIVNTKEIAYLNISLEEKLRPPYENFYKADSLLSQALSGKRELEQRLRSLEELHNEFGATAAIFYSREEKTVVSCTTMIEGYARLGFLDIVLKLFYEMPEKDVAPWNAIIGGYVPAKRSKETLALFHEMQASNAKPNDMTMVNCLSACSPLGALDVGMWIHHCIEKHNHFLNVALGTALVDRYAKCGNIKKARYVFRRMPHRNSLTWIAVICGLDLHGNAKDAVSYFLKMIDIGLMPDDVTFLGVLSACCHGGQVKGGRKHFAHMNPRFDLFSKLKHYSCMVDLLRRAGLLEEAKELMKSMPMEVDAGIWGSLLFAYRIHGNIKMGERAAFKLLELNPGDSGIYVLLTSLYGKANMGRRLGMQGRG